MTLLLTTLSIIFLALHDVWRIREKNVAVEREKEGWIGGGTIEDEKLKQAVRKSNKKWHAYKLAAIVTLFLAMLLIGYNVPYMWPIGSLWATIPIYWVLHDGIISKGLGQPFFYVGTTARIDVMIRKVLRWREYKARKNGLQIKIKALKNVLYDLKKNLTGNEVDQLHEDIDVVAQDISNLKKDIVTKELTKTELFLIGVIKTIPVVITIILISVL